jgi:hypothetical protein
MKRLFSLFSPKSTTSRNLHMKRLLSIFGLAAMLLLGLALPHEAQAAVTIPSDCHQITGNGSTWPNSFTYYCNGATLSDGSTMTTSIAQMHGNGVWAMEKSGVVFFIYGTQAQYKADFAAPVPATTDFGVTAFNSSNVPTFSAIFLKDGESTPKANPNVPNTSAYQASRSLDVMFGYVNNGGVIALPYVSTSGSTNFANELTTDWGTATTTFNALSPCKTSGGFSGVFTEQKDPRSGHGGFVCSGTTGDGTTLNSGYSGTNEAILKLIWPTPFNVNASLLAEETADSGLMGQGNANGSGLSSDYYFNPLPGNEFLCSQEYLTSVLWNGVVPTSTQHSCTLPTTKSVCLQYFDQSSAFPGLGYLINCSVNTDAIPTEVTQNLDRLGTLNGTVTTPPIWKTLESGNVYVYVIPTQANFKSYFQTAGATWQAPSTSAIGVNYSGTTGDIDTGINYAVAFEQQVLNGVTTPLNATQVTEVASHEIGHGMDYILGFSTQSGSTGTNSFDSAIRNDFQNADYSVIGASKAASTKRNPCGTVAIEGYTGPLQGLFDPTTNPKVLFCANGGNQIEAKWTTNLMANGPFDLTSYILQNLGATGGAASFTKLASGTVILGQGTYPGGWSEWYAISFAYNADFDTGGGSANVLEDGVIHNQYFQCTAGETGWLSFIYAGKTVSLPANCKPIPASWYIVGTKQ